MFDTPQVVFSYMLRRQCCCCTFQSIVDGDDDYEEDTTKRKTPNDDGLYSSQYSQRQIAISILQLIKINCTSVGQLLIIMMKQLSEPNTKSTVEESSMIAVQSPMIAARSANTNSKEAGGVGKKMILRFLAMCEL